MGKKEFDKAIKSKLDNLEVAPPEGGFAAIQKRLQKPSPEKVAFIWPTFLKYGLAASFAFLMGLFTMNWYNNDNAMHTGNAIAESNISNPITKDIHAETVSTIAQKETPEIAEVNLLADLATVDEEVFVASDKVNKIEVIPSATEAAKIQKANGLKEKSLEIFTEGKGKVIINVAGVYAAKQLQESENLEVYALYSLENELEEEKIELAKIEKNPTAVRFNNKTDKMGYTGFWFGPSLSGNHLAFGGKNLFGLGLGFDLGYDFSPKFGIQSGVHYKSMVRNIKAFTEVGVPYNDLMDLSNFSIPLALKWKNSYFASNMERPVSFNAYLGGEYARLTKLGENRLGAHIGLEYDIFLKPEMMFTIGVKTGLNHIAGYSPEQAYLQDNYRKVNYAMSFYTSLRFIKPKSLH